MTNTIKNSEKATIRAYVMASRQNVKVRITRSGDVHAYGRMPNTSVEGWYFVGYDHEVLSEARGLQADIKAGVYAPVAGL